MGRSRVVEVPYYDAWSDEIKNVSDKTSYTYFHEVRHKHQCSHGFIHWFVIEYPIFLTFISWVLMIVFVLSVFDTQKELIEFTAIVMMAVHSIKYLGNAILEVDAILYGLYKFKGFQK